MFLFSRKNQRERVPSDPSGSSCWRLVLLTGPIELAATSDVGGNSLRSILLLSFSFLFCPLPPFCPAFQQLCFLRAFHQIYWPFTTHQLLNDTSGSYNLLGSFTFMIINARFISVLSASSIFSSILQVDQVLAVTANRPKRFV